MCNEDTFLYVTNKRISRAVVKRNSGSCARVSDNSLLFMKIVEKRSVRCFHLESFEIYPNEMVCHAKDIAG